MKVAAQARTLAKKFLNSIGMESAPGAIKELHALRALCERSEDFAGLLLNPRFSATDRLAGIKAVGAAMGISEDTQKFVQYLADNGAARALGDVAARVETLYSEQMELARATVITPTPVAEEFTGRIEAALKKLTGREVVIQYVTDPTLLGGMLVKVGSTMYDGSIKGQLRLLRSDLIKG